MISFYQKIKKNINFFGLLLFSVATSFCSYAQEKEDDNIDDLLDDLFFDDQQFVDELLEQGTSFNFIYTSASYNTNTYFSGRDSGIDQFNVIPQVSYYHSSGFNASVSGVYYQNFDPHWDFTSVSLGYLNTLGKNDNVIYSAGYTRFFYNDDFDDFTNSLDVTLGIRNKKKTLGTTFSGSYLFGSDESYQLVSSSFARINIIRKPKYAIRLRPTLNLIVAQQEFSYLEVVQTNSRVRPRERPTINLVSVNVFNLLNTQISVPVSFSVESWDFELAYSLNIPNPVANETGLPTTSFFNFSVGYLFDLSK